MGKGLESAREAWNVFGFLILYELSLPSVPFPFSFIRPPVQSLASPFIQSWLKRDGGAQGDKGLDCGIVFE